MNQSLVEKKKNFIESNEEYVKSIQERKINFTNIPKKIRTYEMCFEAVKINPFNMKEVPEEYLTEDLCFAAIEHDSLAMRYIPKNIRTKKFCLKAIELNKECIRYFPSEYIDDNMAMELVKTDGKNLRYIEEKKRNKDLCLMAFKNNPGCIEYIPKKYIKDEMYLEAVNSDCNILDIVPDKLRTKELIVTTLKTAVRFKENGDSVYTRSIGEAIPVQFESDKDIINLERKCGIRIFTQKKYAKDTNKFYVSEKFSYKDDVVDEEFDSFDKFVEYLNNDLYNADLFEFDFKGIDIKKYDYSNLLINSSVLIENGLYDSSSYEKLILNNKKYLDIPYMDEDNNDISSNNYGLTVVDGSNNNRRIYYISDIHLCHKIAKKFPKHASYIEIIHFIKSLINHLIIDAELYDCLLIGGDTSSSFELTKIFFRLLRKKWKGFIITVLGNHEIWNSDNEISNCGLDDIIQKYRDFFDELENIILLQNDLLFFHEGGIKLLSEEEILNSNDDHLKDLSNRSRLIMLGGLGFSGLNDRYNALCGLYRETLKTLTEDQIQSDRFNKIYNHVKNSLDKTKLIVFTHTQKENWNTDEYVKRWIYVNGHTHQNYFEIDDDKTVYSDNQIGYYRNNLGLKYFETSQNFDYFQYFGDGVYEISRDDYFVFNRGIGLRMDFNKSDGKLIMLKKNGIYCFFYQNPNKKLYLLNGGAVRVLKNQDINYYYETMDILSLAINQAMKNYNNTLKEISKSIRSIGGDGRIHGCIVDIDFFNHIYLNPYDGKVSYYYATSIIDKHVYNSLKSLLSHHNKKLLENYESKNNTENNLSIILANNQIQNVSITEYVPDTLIYSPSRQMLTIQYLTELNVIRFWSDKIIDKIKNDLDSSKIRYLE